VLKPVVERYQGKVSRIYFRADAGFANPDIYEFVEAERIKYAIRLPDAAASCESLLTPENVDAGPSYAQRMVGDDAVHDNPETQTDRALSRW
jgi:hypothetical protein